MIADCRLTLSQDKEILAIDWFSPQARDQYAPEWRAYLHQRLDHLPDFRLAASHLAWKGENFECLELPAPDQARFLILKREDHRAPLYEAALDALPDGVQIYDRHAGLVYLNPASRRLSGIPGHLDLTGRHLLDLYALDEEVSTVLTTLRTQRPVINRVDDFLSADGRRINSVNTGYPVFDGPELAGAVVFERDLATLETQIAGLEEMRKSVRNKVSRPSGVFTGFDFSDLIGRHPELVSAINLARKIAPRDCPVLLVGETGTGKEIFAQGIHKASDRRHKKFVALNCAAVPESLVESFFFGTSKGSFTGSEDKPGLLEEADGGVLFLDELNSMSLGLQSKLLRVIQEGVFRRVGGARDLRADVRFISACNEDPASLVRRNILRRDLFHRLSTVTVEIPPLRDRPEDMEELVHFYLAKCINRYAKSCREVAPEVLARFRAYDWPGNVRELFNVLDYVLNTMDGDRLELKHLPRALRLLEERPAETAPGGQETSAPAASSPGLPMPGGSDLPARLREAEKRIIEDTLLRCRYNFTKAAAELGLSRQRLQYRAKKLGLAS